MTTEFSLAMTARQHKFLFELLYPGDRRESVAILLCGRRAGTKRHRLVVREVCPILTQWYRNRSEQSVTWSTDALEHILDLADRYDLSIIKVHSHPSGYSRFSKIDDEGDLRLLPAIRDSLENVWPHGSGVMLPDGQLFGRILAADRIFTPFDSVMVIGDQLRLWRASAPQAACGDFTASHGQAFGRGTIEILSEMTIAVVGCSGTGSVVVEQLVRLGVKRIILVDDDVVEIRNLNRILNSTRKQAEAGASKVEALADGITRIDLGTEVTTICANLASRVAIDAVAEADAVFGCMDTIEGRYVLNRLATFYTMPYFDVGVRLVANDDKGLDEVCGTVNYLKPGGSSLISRGLFSMDEVAADGLKRRDPLAHKRQVDEGYIRGAVEQRPAVISVNMLAASLAVNEFLARIHPYRDEQNSEFSSIGFSLASMELYADPDGGPCELLGLKVGHGDVEPKLGVMDFATRCSG